MKPSRIPALPILFSILLLAASANAEVILPINPAGTGVFTFDQPSVAVHGSAVHVAFIGDAEGDGAFKLYYAAVNGSANFQSSGTTLADVLLTPAVAIDNGAAYDDVRHPQIAAWDANRLVVVFQGVPAGTGAGNYKLFLAVINIRNNAVTSHTVREIVDASSARLGGVLVDPSFQAATSDNTLRIAYTDASDEYGRVYFARVGLDNASVAGNPILLSSIDSSRGVKPVPRLKLDQNGYSHVVWAANKPLDEPTGIYYSLVRRNSSGTPDNVAIGPTQVIFANKRWGFPMVVVEKPSNVFVFAVDQPFNRPGIAGSLGITRINPSAVTHDGQPVNVGNAAALAAFFTTQPGGLVASSSFDAYQPEVFFDLSEGYFHIASYGYRGTAFPFQGTGGTFYVISLEEVLDQYSVLSDPVFVLKPVPVGTGDISHGMQIAGDYTRAAFASFHLKAVHFWSGPDGTTPGASNLYVTSTVDADISSSDSSGCSVAKSTRNGDAGRIPGALLLLSPAAVLLFLKAARRFLARR